MASVSSLGIGSGIDAEKIVTQLVAIERKPVDAINQRTETLQAKLSAFSLVQSYMTNLQDASDVLAKASTWQQTKVSSADDTSISATTTTGASPGNLAVQVTQLAQAQSLVTPAYTSSLANVGTGTLRIELGTWSAGNTAFTQKTGSTGIDVVIAPGQDSLEAVRTAINAANAGVSASIVRDASGARLALRSTTTGLENGLRITATADAPATPGGATLAGLVYNPAAGASPLTETQPARDAMATVNGLAVTSPRNTLTGVVEGLTLEFKKVTTAPIQLSVSNDTTAMRKAVDDFTKAYNDLNKYVAEQTKYDPDKKVAATLQGDRSTLSLQTQLRAMVGSNGAASPKFTRLSDMGVQIQADGSLKVDDTKFGNATSALNLPDLALAFSQKNGTASADGFATRISALVQQLTGSQGTVTTRSDGLRASIKRSQDDAQKASDRADAAEARLRKQYSALDTSMAKLNTLSTYVNQQITTWNKSS